MFQILKGMINKQYEDITAQEVQNIYNNKNIQIIDVREPHEFSFGHIPNSKLLPLGQIDLRLKELDKEKEIIVVCASGMRSSRAARILSANGYKVKNLLGGMGSWTGKIVK